MVIYICTLSILFAICMYYVHLCGYTGAVPIHVHVQQEIEYIADFT